MKAIVIKSPYWEKILSGEKTIETRTWATKHRGTIAICAAKPIKCVVGFVDIIDVREMTEKDEKAACIKLYKNAKAWVLKNPRKIEFKPVRGMPGIFEVEL